MHTLGFFICFNYVNRTHPRLEKKSAQKTERKKAVAELGPQRVMDNIAKEVPTVGKTIDI